ncbi:hypothetical protein LTR94_035891, partial [Friedmanniomyces endolithicus]
VQQSVAVIVGEDDVDRIVGIAEVEVGGHQRGALHRRRAAGGGGDVQRIERQLCPGLVGDVADDKHRHAGIGGQFVDPGRGIDARIVDAVVVRIDERAQ